MLGRDGSRRRRPPVFVVGVERSGTTLLYRTLALHPSFTHDRLNLAESHAVDLLYEFVDADAPAPQPLRTFLLGQDVPPEVRATIRRLRRRRLVVRRLAGPQRAWLPALWRLAGEHMVVRSYFAAAERIRGAPRLVEKTPAHLARVELLWTAFPNAPVLCMERHPVDVLASHRRRYAFDGPAAAWADVGVQALAARWAQSALVAGELRRRRPGQFSIIRYEDLAANPERTMRSVLERLGEPYDPACLRNFAHPATHAADPLFGQEIEKSASRWREHASVEDARALEDLLTGPMHSRSYPRYTAVPG